MSRRLTFETVFTEIAELITKLSVRFTVPDAGNLFLNYKLLKKQIIEIDRDLFPIIKDVFRILFGKNDKKVSKFKNRFCLIFHFLKFWRSQKINKDLRELCLLLKWKHLSVTGFDLMSQLGILPSVPTVNSLIHDLSEQSRTSSLSNVDPHNAVYWADNFVRDIIQQNFGRRKYELRSTVFACFAFKSPSRSLVFSDPSLPLATLDGFFSHSVLNIVSDLLNSVTPTINFYTYFDLGSIDFLRVPLKSTNSTPSLVTYNLNLLEIPTHTQEGFIQILNQLSEISKAVGDKSIRFFLFDYDLYWKYFRILFTTSHVFKSFRECVYVSLGNWHVCYKLATGIWEIFSPFFLDKVYYAIFKRIPKSKPPYSDQMKVYLFLLSRVKCVNSFIDKELSSICYFSYKTLLTYFFNYCLPLTVQIHLSLINNDPVTFYEILLPHVISVFSWVGYTNYLNATQLSILQYYYLKVYKHPAYKILLENFSSFNEDQGERSLNILSKEIEKTKSTDIDYLRQKYLLVNYYNSLCKRLQVTSYKKSKNHSMANAKSIPIANPTADSNSILALLRANILHYKEHLESPYSDSFISSEEISSKYLHHFDEAGARSKTNLHLLRKKLSDNKVSSKSGLPFSFFYHMHPDCFF